MNDDLIPMPNLYDNHVRIGKEASSKGEYEIASEHFEAAYDLKDTFEANFLWSESLYALKDFRKSYEVLRERESEYTGYPEALDHYFNVLLKQHYHVKLEALLASLSKEEEPLYRERYQHVLDYLEVMEKPRIEERIQQVSGIVTASPREQVQRVKAAEKLPKVYLEALCVELLLSTQVLGMVKAQLIDYLSSMGSERVYDVCDITDNIRRVKPKALLSLNKATRSNPVYQQVLTRVEQEEPNLYEGIKGVIRLHVGCLYPFDKELMQPTDQWVSSYLVPYGIGSEGGNFEENMDGVMMIQGLVDEEVMGLMTNP